MNVPKSIMTHGLPAILAIISAAAVFAMASHAQAAERADALDTQGDIRQAGAEYWKHSSQTFPLTANGQFSLDNINGRIEIRGWNSNAVVLVTDIHGKTSEAVAAVKVEIEADSNHITVHTEQQSEDNKQSNATVDYIVQVPQQAMLQGISSVNGRVAIEGVAGDIVASTVNGETQVKGACHNLKLNTVNGSITAEMNSLGSGQSVSFNTVNGRVGLALPENADAQFTMSTLNGRIGSEFPGLQAQKEFPVGNKLKGSLGSGDAEVKGQTVNGSIDILKHAPAGPASNPVPASYH